MKYLIASDIHGSAYWCRKLMEAMAKEQPEMTILLGDLLYHGPRNDLPDEYAPKQVIEMLNGVSERLVCVRGNCEAEVDQMVLSFPIMADYALLYLNGIRFYATHGHIRGADNPPPMPDGSVLLCGHTHIPAYREIGNSLYVNPGSVSIPKQSSPHSYVILDEYTLFFKNLSDLLTYKTVRIR